MFKKKPQRKETDSGDVYIFLPQPFLEAYELWDAWFVLSLGCQVDGGSLHLKVVVMHPRLSKTAYRTRTFLTLFLEYRLKGKGRREQKSKPLL